MKKEMRAKICRGLGKEESEMITLLIRRFLADQKINNRLKKNCPIEAKS
jgi:hypothetical protein